MENFNFNINQKSYSDKGISIDKFSVSINSKKLFNDSPLKINNGSIYGLIGINGSGKSTLLKLIKNKKFPVNPSLDVLYVEQEIESTSETPVELVLKSNYELIKYQKLFEEIEKKLEEEPENEENFDKYDEIQNKLQNLDCKIQEPIVRKILSGLGFTNENMDKPSNEFSGGWKMRISLAKALYRKPDILLLDEPTNHLDLEAVIWLGDYLSDYDNNKAVIVVSHNVGFLNNICSHILNIEDHKLVTYKGNYHNFKNLFEIKMKQINKKWEQFQKKVKKLRKKKGLKNKDIELMKKEENIIQPLRDYNVKIDFFETPTFKNNIISVENLTFGYDNVLFKNVDFGINTESKIVLVGKNGSGKSTLLKLIMGEIEVEDDNVFISRQSKLRIGYYHQHFEDILPKDKTPVEYLESLVPDDLEGDKRLITRKYLGRMKLEGKAHNSLIGDLSGGQKARVALVKLIFQKPHLIIMDEPTNHLDIKTVEALIEGLKNFNGGLLIITHEAELINQMEEIQLWVLQDKKIYFYSKTFDDYCDQIINS